MIHTLEHALPTRRRDADNVSWQPEVDEIERRRRMAMEMGGSEGVARQHAKGRLSVRERIEALLDADSFREIGTLFGQAAYDDDGRLAEFTHVSRVIGTGCVDGRPVAIDAGDFTIRGGWADPTSFVGAGRFSIEQLAVERRIPYIRLLDSAGGSVESIRVKGRTVLLGGPHLYGPWHTLMAHVPVVSTAGTGCRRSLQRDDEAYQRAVRRRPPSCETGFPPRDYQAGTRWMEGARLRKRRC